MAKVENPDVEPGTDVARTNIDVDAAIAALNDGSAGGYSSIKGTDFGSRVKVAAALTSSVPIDDHKGEVINLAHMIIQTVEIPDSNTGETVKAPRVTLIDADGSAYHATSVGLLGSARTILTTLGEPETWPEPVPVKIVEKRSNNGWKFFTIEFVTA